jgi:nicotinamide-nucleotide amidase
MDNDQPLFELAEQVGRKLLGAHRRLVTAESCTAGWVAKAITDVAGSSQWFECGLVTYSNAAKVRELGVSERTLARYGAVSEQTVREMALGALRVAGVEVAISVSGIAGPDGGTPDKPVGTVWFGLAFAGTPRGGVGVTGSSAVGVTGDPREALQPEVISELRHFTGDRREIRWRSVEHALRLLLRFDGS